MILKRVFLLSGLILGLVSCQNGGPFPQLTGEFKLTSVNASEPSFLGNTTPQNHLRVQHRAEFDGADRLQHFVEFEFSEHTASRPIKFQKSLNSLLSESIIATGPSAGGAEPWCYAKVFYKIQLETIPSAFDLLKAYEPKPEIVGSDPVTGTLAQVHQTPQEQIQKGLQQKAVDQWHNDVALHGGVTMILHVRRIIESDLTGCQASWPILPESLRSPADLTLTYVSTSIDEWQDIRSEHQNLPPQPQASTAWDWASKIITSEY